MTTITTTKGKTTTCLLYSLEEEEEEDAQELITDIPTPRSSLDKEDPPPQKEAAAVNVALPPTPSTSDDEQDQQPSFTTKRLSRRDSVSLADLIPIASAALRSKHRFSSSYNDNDEVQQQQESPLARALTKVKMGVITHRIKIKYLTNEWIRLALAVPLDETTINSNVGIIKTKRTKQIVAWYEYKFKRVLLSLEQVEEKVDELRRQRLLYIAALEEEMITSPVNKRFSSLLVK